MEQERRLPMFKEAEQFEFPPIPDDKVWCRVRGLMVGSTDCATDACLDPSQRPACWEGHIARSFDWTQEER